MKNWLALWTLLATAGVCHALDNSIGLFFSDVAFSRQYTNINPEIGVPFEMHVVFLSPTLELVAGYEVAIGLDGALTITSIDGPNGWTNYGSDTNHLVGYGTPLPANPDGTVFASLTMIASSEATVELRLGPSVPSSVNGCCPAVADSENLYDLVLCSYASCEENWEGDPEYPALVATIHGDGVSMPPLCPDLPIENQNWSTIKGLFD